MNGYIVAHSGSRDFYQVALSLQERDLLDTLVTTFYKSNSLFSYVSRLTGRVNRQLDSEKVYQSTQACLFEMVHRKAPSPRSRKNIETKMRQSISRKASHLAAQSDSNLLLYSDYAYEAFTDPAMQDRVRGLFFYHPHERFQYTLLTEDYKSFPEAVESYGMVHPHNESPRANDEYKYATHFVVASTFTRLSLESQGVDPAKVTVIPYGFTTRPEIPQTKPDPDPVEFLFVGAAVQRKGIHHLLKVWKDLNLPNARLTIQARAHDHGIRKSMSPEDVRWIGGMPRRELLDLFENSHVFVMPSLVEGFGHVYLEAMSMGCHAIGTRNTGLPDLGCSENANTIIEASDLDALADAIKRAYERARNQEFDPAAIAAEARQWDWTRFRNRLGDTVAQWHR